MTAACHSRPRPGTAAAAGLLRRFARDESGTTAIEYAVIAAGISVAIVGAVSAVGSGLRENFYNKLTTLF